MEKLSFFTFVNFSTFLDNDFDAFLSHKFWPIIRYIKSETVVIKSETVVYIIRLTLTFIRGQNRSFLYKFNI